MDSLLEGDPSREGDPEDASGNGKKAAKISVRRRSNEIVKNFLIVAVYLLVGGLVFKAVESGPEKDRREEDWVVLSTLKVDGGASLTSDADSAKEFRAVLAGLHSSCELKSPERDYDFDFQGSMFFALTVVTTIGYGNFVPTTVFGMWLVVVYAIFGISLILTFIFQTAHLYVMIVKGLLQRFAKLKVRAKRGVAHELSFANYCGNGTEVNAKDLRSALEDLAGCDGLDESIVAYAFSTADRNKTGTLDSDEFLNAVAVFLQIWHAVPKGADLTMMIVACVAIFLWIVVWGSSIASIEDWTFREGVWFGFISLTTIGFGDKAPDSHLGRMMAFAFIFVGMGIVAWFVQSIVQLYDRTKFWKAQRLYEKGYLSDKYMDVHEYCFKSPLGLPVRWKFLGFESNNAPRPPTLSREYQAMIDSSSPKVQSTEADEKGNASGDLVVDIKEGDGGKGEGKEARQLDAENSSDSLRKKKKPDKKSQRKVSNGGASSAAADVELEEKTDKQEGSLNSPSPPVSNSPDLGPKRVRSVKKKKRNSLEPLPPALDEL